MYFGLKIILRIWSASLLLFSFLLFLSLGNACGVVLWKWIPFELSVLTLVCLCWVEIGWTKFSSIWVYNVYFCYGCKGAQISSARDFAFFGRVRMFVSWFLCYFFCKWRWWPGSLYAEKFAFFFFKWEAEFNESPPIHGSDSCCIFTPCNAYHGRKCGWYHTSSCQRRCQDHLVLAIQLLTGVFCESDQLLGYKTHKCSNSPGRCLILEI